MSMDILKALDDPKVFGPSFRDPETWKSWRAYLAALFALPMSEEQLVTYRNCTGREDPPADPVKESWLVVGRRGGKSFILAIIAIYLAVFKDWRPYLGPGEVGTVMVIAQDRKQARAIMNFIKGILKGTRMLAATVEAERVESIDLANSIRIEVHNCSSRSTRGYTVVAALLDEMAIWRGEDAANPDVEVLSSIRPAMVTIPGAMLLCASSPISRKGCLWEAYHRSHGGDGPHGQAVGRRPLGSDERTLASGEGRDRSVRADIQAGQERTQETGPACRAMPRARRWLVQLYAAPGWLWLRGRGMQTLGRQSGYQARSRVIL